MSTLDRVFERAFSRQISIPVPHVHFGDSPSSTPAAEETPPESVPIELSPSDEPTLGAGDVFSEARLCETPAAAAPFEPLTTSGDAAAAMVNTVAEASSVPRRWIEQFNWPAVVQALCSSASESFSSLITEWQTVGRSTTVAVTSAEHGEGSSSVALALAKCCSARGLRTLLIDGDFARPALAAALKVNVDCGWERTLTGQDRLPGALVEASGDCVVLLPLGATVPRSQLVACALGAVLRSLKTRFDFVCLDAGPLCDGHEWFAEPSFDRVLCVCDVRRAPSPERDAFERRMRERGVSCDIVENFTGSRHV